MTEKLDTVKRQAAALAMLIDSPGWKLIEMQLAQRLREADEALHNVLPDDVINVVRQQTAYRLYSQILTLPQDMLESAYQTIAKAGNDQ